MLAKWLVTVGATLLATTAAYAQNCEPVPSTCKRAQDRGMQLLNEFPRTSGIADSASKAYCALLIGVEVNNYCAQEYRRLGKADCARVLDQQTAEYRRTMGQVQQTVSASSASGVRQKCKWEGGR
jgi:hypothetical protein